jgi:tetratricopeptide (TPR) repeat protein
VDQAFVLNQAGLCLRALGRLAEGVQPVEAAFELSTSEGSWRQAAIQADNLCEFTLTLGEVKRAVRFGLQSVDLADRSGDDFGRITSRTALADALHQAGNWEESEDVFHQAEALQAEFQPGYPQLYSVHGYLYCDLLLSRGEPKDGSGPDGLAADPNATLRFREACQEVRERGDQMLEWAIKGSADILSVALGHLGLGRSHLGLALTAASYVEAVFGRAAEHLGQAVEGLRRSGREDFLPRSLLARVILRRMRGDLAGAEADLSESLEIAERGSMRLHECDARLEWTRLCRQRGDQETAERHLAQAQKIIEETGYFRRAREAKWLAGQLH